MPAFLTASVDRARALVSRFTIAQRTIAVIGVALVVLGAIALGSWLARPQMSPLFTGLSASDASAVVEQLKSAGVPYELTDGGATILVPDDKVYAQRLTAASAGLPSDTSKGYTLLDKMGVTASEFQQSVTYKRAIEGELANTIGAMNGITASSVQLAIPKESVFVSEKQNPTASVFVKTRNGTTLNDGQVEAIVHLTSAAVSGMRPEDVTVTDQNGKVLSAAGTGLTGGGTKQAGEYEAKVSSSVGSMLETIVGAGNATVTVAADVANSTSEKTDETYSVPTGSPTGSETSRTETYGDGKGGSSGVLGPDNIAVPSGAPGSGGYKLEENTKANPVNKSTEKTTTPAGEVIRQTVSVALNQDAVKGVSAEQIRSLVATAAGIDTKRGDTVTVEFVPFSRSGASGAAAALDAAEKEKQAQAQGDLLRTMIIASAIVLAAIILVAFLAYRSRRRRQGLEDSGPIAMLETMSESEEQKLRALRSLSDPVAMPFAALSHEPPTAVLDLEEEPEADQILVERRRREIDEIVRSHPESAAVALASLMDEATA